MSGYSSGADPSAGLEWQTDRVRRAGLRETSLLTLNTSQLGVGLGLAGGLLFVHALWRFLDHVEDFPRLVLNIASWAILFVTVVLVVIALRAAGFIFSTLLFWSMVLSLTVAAVLDFAAVWQVVDDGVYPTSAIAVGAVLLGASSLRPAREIVMASAILGVGLLLGVLVPGPGEDRLGPLLLLLVLAIVPPLIAASILGEYRRHILLALDRVLTQSAISAPVVLTAGMLGSAELAELDHEVEELFDDVATGREPLPLSPERADQASALATELRRHLVAGHQDTWLSHAVSESEFLSDHVTIDDANGLSARLDQLQRDGLLSGLWMLMSSAARMPATARVSFIERRDQPRADSRRVLIALDVDGIGRSGVEAITWAALRRVGRYTDTATPLGLRVDIEAEVAVTQDQPR
jgi:HPt (histidine-containing phosphotransfer) domain-containing protein